MSCGYYIRQILIIFSVDKNVASVTKEQLFSEAQFVAELLKYEFIYKLNPDAKEVRISAQ
jgi:hypothetical protein